MADKSFYNLDYIIEINEKRVEQNTAAYHKVLDRLTNIILIYSALTIFLVPIIQDTFLILNNNWFLYISFAFFTGLISTSIYYTVRLMIPEEIAYLEAPKRYYTEYFQNYQETIKEDDPEQKKAKIGTLLKASYIEELELAASNNMIVFRNKSSYYYRALMFGLLAVIPYIICLAFHISKKDNKIQKVEIVNSKKILVICIK